MKIVCRTGILLLAARCLYYLAHDNKAVIKRVPYGQLMYEDSWKSKQRSKCVKAVYRESSINSTR
jgi:hypothetical protein